MISDAAQTALGFFWNW